MSATVLIFYLVFIIALFYFVLIRPQKKKQREEQKLRDSIQVGDEILTIGGIYGRIVSIKEDCFIIESVADHSKLKISRWALSQNLTVHEDTVSEKSSKK